MSSEADGNPAMNGEAGERTPEQVQAEIEETRAELGETVEALVAKTDVKGQAKQAVTDAKATVAAKAADVKETVTGKKDDVTAAVQETAPGSVGETGRRAVALAQDNRPALTAVAIFALGLLI
jgi:Protein of unknown function (DUF3618)